MIGCSKQPSSACLHRSVLRVVNAASGCRPLFNYLAHAYN
ncbi:hypothetical protein ID866_2956 [Astraeus odoratus]|nr:hypothetical protein ID866_2956 [Astraeus odoratus]